MIYWLGHIFWVVTSKLLFPCRVAGLANLPRGGFIFASNHVSNLDPMLIGISSRRRLSYMAKDSLFKNNFFRFILYQVGAFPVKRGAADVGAMREALKRLKNGCPVVVFPEGTRKKSEAQAKAHAGIGFLALKSGLPVVPVFIKGADKVLPPGAKFPRRHLIEVEFGAPTTYSEQDPYPAVADQILQQINALGSV